jgi:hypothetical protein
MISDLERQSSSSIANNVLSDWGEIAQVTNLTWLKLAGQVVERRGAADRLVPAAQLHAIFLCQVRACVKSKKSLANADALWAEIGIQ